MTENKFLRKSVRLSWYNYTSSGYYFITVCSYNRKNIFGEIIASRGIARYAPTTLGIIVQHIWCSLPEHHNVKIHTFQLMPNHIHGVIEILPSMSRGIARYAPTEDINKQKFGHIQEGSLSAIMRSFKSECTKQIRTLLKDRGYIVWQRGFYEHVIKNEAELFKIQQYIIDNPSNWKNDKNYA